MVALVENGEVMFSAIYDFVHDTMYHTVRNHGAFKNDMPISVSNRKLQQSYLGYESNLKQEGAMSIFNRTLGKFNRIQYMSAGYEYAMIAEGKMDGRIVNGAFGNNYDFAPGTLLVKEAGGVVTNIGLLTYSLDNYNHIAANPQVNAELTTGADCLFPLD